MDLLEVSLYAEITSDEGYVLYDNISLEINRLTLNSKTNQNQTYTSNSLNNQYNSIDNGIALLYDNAGNMTRDDRGYTYAYDYENRIVEVKNASNTTVAEYAYDALGRRIRKIVEPTTTNEATFYYYTDKWQVATEYPAYLTDDDIPNLVIFDKANLWGSYIDELYYTINREAGMIRNAFIPDHLYSNVAAVDYVTETVTERYEYNAYGKATIYDADYSQVRSETAIGNDYLFTGRRYDPETGNHYYRNRYYNQDLARFLQKDPLGIAPNTFMGNEKFAPKSQYTDGGNLYQYVRSNSLNGFDPFGLDSWWNYPSDNNGDPGMTGATHRAFGGSSESGYKSFYEEYSKYKSSFGGLEAHYFGGMGLTLLSCKDECNKPKSFSFIKYCFGGEIGGGVAGGRVKGMDGKGCRAENYEGWFYESALGLGPWGFGVDFGYNHDGSRSDVIEVDLSLGRKAIGIPKLKGTTIKSTWCYYMWVGGDGYDYGSTEIDWKKFNGSWLF